MYKIVVTEPAEQDLKGAISYFANELKNPTVAMDLLNDFNNKVTSLSDMPKRYKTVEDEYLATKGIRLMTVSNYLVFYVVHDDTDTVSIIRFLYGRRDWNSILKLDSEEVEQ